MFDFFLVSVKNTVSCVSFSLQSFLWCFLFECWFGFDGTLSYLCFYSLLWYVRNIFFDGFFYLALSSTAAIGVTCFPTT